MFFGGVGYWHTNMTKKFFCDKCSKRIKAKEIPWCQNCRIIEFNKQKKVAGNKSNIKMDEKENKSGEETDAEEEAEETIDNLPDVDEEGEIL